MEYYIQIIDSDTNEIIEEYSVEEGGYIELPEPPEGYEYASWSDYDSYVYEDTTIYVELRKLTFTAYVYDDVNGYIGEYEVEYGDDFYPELPPDIEGYEFVEYQWNDGSSSDYFPYVTEDIYLTLHYEKLYYHVTFYDTVDGSEFDSVEVAYGEDAYLPDPPEHDGYEFSYWSSDGYYITEDTTIEAYYESVQYTVDFYAIDENGNDLQWIDTQNYYYGDYIYCPSEPDIDGYEFSYWQGADDSVTGDITVYAVYERRQYEVTFIDSIYDYYIYSTYVYYGEAVDYWPDPPEYEWYRFIGWDNDGSCITEETTITAQYEASPYYHRFYIYDVETGEQELYYTLEITEDNQYDVEAPEIPEAPDGVNYSDEWLDYDSFYSWYFSYCDADYHIIKKSTDTEYVPVIFFDYSSWKNLGFIYVPYGAVLTEYPEYDLGDEYLFNHHDEITEPITSSTQVNYYYDSCCVVTYIDGFDNSIIGKEKVKYYEDATLPEVPVHEGFLFAGWRTDSGEITSGANNYLTRTITAVFKEPKTYKVEYYVYKAGKNGFEEFILVGTDPYDAGETLKIPGIDYSYDRRYYFKEWFAYHDKVNQDEKVYAIFVPYTNGNTWYLIKYITNDVPGVHNLGFRCVQHYDDVPLPVFEIEGYEFTRWSGDQMAYAFRDTSYTYYYTKLPTLRVRYLDWDGTVISSQTVIKYKDAVSPADPVREGYTFSGWTEDGKYVDADIDITATYTEDTHTSRDFTVVFVDYNGKEISSQTVQKGGSATAPPDPIRLGYNFAGWDKPYTNIKADTIITATYTARTDKFTVKFVDWNNKLLSEQTITYGMAAIAPEVDARTGYIFTGWSRDFGFVTDNIIVYAIYKTAFVREEIEVYSGDNCVGKINMAISCTIRQALNGECTISLKTLAKFSAIIQPGYNLRYRELLFNITKITKQTQNGLYVVTVEGEHISYGLTDCFVDEFYFTGTPHDCLNVLLAGTGLVAGNCDIDGEITLNINKEGTTLRAVLNQLIAITGGELEYSYNTIGISTHIGTTRRVELLDTLNVTDLAMEYSAADGTSYDISLSRKTGINLGDEIHIGFSQFSIDADERIYSIEYNPFNFREVKITIGDYVEEYNEDLYKAVDDMQGKLDELKEDLEKTKKKVNDISWSFPDDDSDGDEITRVLSVDGIPSGEAVDKHTLYLIRGEATFR